MRFIKTNWRMLLICLVLAGSTLATFWPVVHHDFINIDDPPYVRENKHINTGLSWQNIVWSFQAGYASNWHPLTWISHMLDVQIYGLNPGGHHLTNLLFHIANTLLLFALLRRMTGAMWRSAFVAALFALHPLHVESVAWISERKDVLSAFFFFLTLMAYHKYVTKVQCPKSNVQSQEPRTGSPKTGVVLWYLLALVLFALGLMSKPMLVTLPFVLLLLDFWPLSRWQRAEGKGQRAKGEGRRAEGERRGVGSSMFVLFRPSSIFHLLSSNRFLLLEKLPFLGLSAASCVVTVIAQDKGEAIHSLQSLPIENRLANAAVSCVAYLKQTFWPANLSIFYPLPKELPTGEVFATAAILLVIFIIAVALARRLAWLPVGWFWFLGMLVPVIGLVQVGMQSRADRYMYLPLIGIFLVLVWGGWHCMSIISPQRAKNENTERRQTASSALTPLHRWLLVTVAGGVVIVLAVTTFRQVQYWRSSQSLFQHAVEVASDNPVAWQCLGIADLERNDATAALSNFDRALECPNCRSPGEIEYGIGVALQAQDKWLDALPHLEKAAVPPELRAHRDFRLGVSLVTAKRFGEAEVALKRALEKNPESPEYQLGMGFLLRERGDKRDAEQLFRQVLTVQPDNALAHRWLGDLLLLLDRPSDAASHYATALRLKPPYPQLLQAHANALARAGRIPEALSQLEEAIRLAPANPSAHFDLAELLSHQGRKLDAVIYYEKALEKDPKMLSALNNLAWLLATDADVRIRNGARAVELAERACEITEWKTAFLMGTLAAAYAEAGRFEDAVRTAEKARDTAKAQQQEEIAKRNAELIELYRQGKAYHEKAAPTNSAN